MSTKSLVFTLNSLDLCCRHQLDDDWFHTFAVPDDGSWGVMRLDYKKNIYILDRSAHDTQARIVIDLNDSGYFGRLKPAGKLQALQRIYHIAASAHYPRAWFPETWDQYVAPNLISVYAYSLNVGRERLVVKMMRNENSIFCCAVTPRNHSIKLEEYEPNLEAYREASSHFEEAAQEVEQLLIKLNKPIKDGVFDLEEVAYGAVSNGVTYTPWLSRLSEAQKGFVNAMPNRSQKLRGPAGTGKTLAMILKTLHEYYRAQDSEKTARILYITHSWGVADQVQSILDQIDERGITNQIDVLPLLTLAQLRLDHKNIRVLGDDSYQGKEAQLRALAELVARARKGDWNAYESSCSPSFAKRVTSNPGTVEANRFLWDLMLEFACVISANGILPGFSSEQRYKQIERRPWMMPLENDADKEFVFSLYAGFIGDLIGREEMTTDQVISDFLNLLSTFRWYSERLRMGYDMIFVDEFHLFNEQERMVFHNLTRNPNSHPVIFMAMDPRQSPSETYAEFSAPGLLINGNGESERILGTVESIDLSIVYRYTQQILNFLQLIDRYFPTLDLGADWNISIANAVTERGIGPKPEISFLPNESKEIDAALSDAIDLANSGKRVALLCLDAHSFTTYKSYVKENNLNRFESVESRDDVEPLRYKKRIIVLSQPHYVAGLQFDAVVIGGFRATFRQYDANQAYGLRRFLSDFYLGASRARDILHIFSSGNQADFPNVLQAALDSGVLEVKAS